MDIAYITAKYLARAGFGVLGTDVFAGQIPAEVDGLYVMRAAGQMNKYLPLEESVVDIYCKDIRAATAIDKLEDIKRHIHRMHNTSLDDAYIYSILVVGDVTDIQRDIEFAKIYKITVQVLCRDTDLIS